tara:strand:+ start:653 stop:1237 length:585 start_codon:yes stop_codon:yes gene_type:complete
MEFIKLAQTCKTLYDVDYLNNMHNLEKRKRHPMIKYENLYEYFNEVTKFQINVKKFLQNILDDDKIFFEIIMHIEWLNDEILFIKSLRIFLIQELLLITKQTEKKWCQDICTITISSIKGALKGLEYASDNITKNNIRDMVVCVIFNIFCTQDNYKGLFDKISFMECCICKKLKSNVIHMDKLICETCFTPLNT